MNIYNFIYCYFYNQWKNKGGGRIDTSAHVLFAVIIHVLLLSEFILSSTGVKIISLPDFGEHGKNKYVYFLLALPIWIGLVIFYNNDRTKRLLKEYQLLYGASGVKNTLKIFFYIVFPTILLIALAVIRQRNW